MFRFWERHFLFLEGLLSVVLVGALWWILKSTANQWVVINYLDGLRQAIYGSIISVDGALLGFVIAGLSILLTLGDSTPGIRYVKASPLFPQLYRVYFSTSWILAVGVAVSLLALLADRDGHPLMPAFYAVVWTVTLSSFRISRCIWVLGKLMNLLIRSGSNSKR